MSFGKAGNRPYRWVEADAWPAFGLPWDDTSESPTDMSRYLEKPAGAHGFIGRRNGRLVDGAGNFVVDGDAGEANAELILDDEEIVQGGTVSVTSLVVTAGNAG